MRTSREIYHWIRWDPRFDPSEFAFGIAMHDRDPKEIALLAFVPDGEIPWHRVLYLRRGAHIVWDRRTGLDRLEAGAGEARVRWPSWTRFAALAPIRSTSDGAAHPLSVLSFNVLDEQHVPEALAHPARASALIESILAIDATIVVLQEVTGAFAQRMLDDPRMRAIYHCSHGLDPAAPQSVLVLSKLAIQWSGALRFSSQKSATVVGVVHESGPLLVAGVHLPSDFSKDSRDLRRAYLRALRLALAECKAIDTIIAGDFNEGDARHEGDFSDALGDFEDLWTVAGQGAGATWEPAVNALSAHVSRTADARRLDRIWLRAPSGTLRARAATVHRPAVLDAARGLYASDHWALAVELGSEDPRVRAAWEPDPASALVLPIDGALEAAIAPIRALHDAHASRWPTHVTLAHPFAPVAQSAAVDALLREVSLAHEPFSLRVSGAGHFDNSKERVVVLHVESPALEALARAVRTRPALARCFDRERSSLHITVARGAPDDRALHALERALSAQFTGERAEIGAMQWLCKGSDGVMRPRASVALGDSAHARRERALHTVDRALSALIDESERRRVWPIGSHAMGAADEESDLDVLAVVPSWCEPELFYDQAAATLRAHDGVSEVELVDTATVPIVRCVVHGVSVDVQRAIEPSRVELRGPAHYTDADLDGVDPDSRRALLAALDARALVEHVERAGAFHTYATLVANVKRWARARQLTGQAYGWMSGLAYAVLAATVAGRHASATDEEALAQWFERMSAWGGEQAIALGAAGASRWVRSGRDVLPVLAPSSPARSVTRSMTPSTRTHWRDEVARARALLAKGDRDRVWEPLAEAPKHCVTVVAYARDESSTSLARARGFVEGRLLRAVMALDERGLRPRPFPQWTREEGAVVRFVIGLRTGAAPQARAEVARAFDEGPIEVECDWR